MVFDIISTPFQQQPTSFQHHFNIIATSLQHHFNIVRHNLQRHFDITRRHFNIISISFTTGSISAYMSSMRHAALPRAYTLLIVSSAALPQAAGGIVSSMRHCCEQQAALPRPYRCVARVRGSAASHDVLHGSRFGSFGLAIRGSRS